MTLIVRNAKSQSLSLAELEQTHRALSSYRQESCPLGTGGMKSSSHPGSEEASPFNRRTLGFLLRQR